MALIAGEKNKEKKLLSVTLSTSTIPSFPKEGISEGIYLTYISEISRS